MYYVEPPLADTFIITPLWTWIKSIGGSDIDEALDEIVKSINWNESIWCTILSRQPTGCYEYDQVEAVLNCYTQLAGNGTVPEYNPNHPEKNKILQTVADCSGQTTAVVQVVLDQLYYATKDGRIKTAIILYPKTAGKYEEQRSLPAKVVGGFGNAVADVTSTAKWILIAGAVGVVGYYGWQAYAASQITTKALKS